MGEVVKEKSLRASGWGYYHQPCTQCQTPTAHKSTVCGECRTLDCKDCGTRFITHTVGLRRCGLCVRRLKRKGGE